MSDLPERVLANADKIDWLRLIRSANVGPITFFRLLEHFGTAQAALDALPEFSRRGGGKAIKPASRAVAEREFDQINKLGAKLIAWGEPGYPPLLHHIEDPPPLISVLGHSHLLTKKSIAIVGARNASINGRKFSNKMAHGLGAGGLMVCSGMARGIDAAAHLGALETGTVAVLAGGVDIVYPKENQVLYEQLIERGAVISEIAPGIQPQARHFPQRNRIISGMARGVVVIEAGARSGSLITARMALEQGREVFAVPGAPGDPRSLGGNSLIRSGATLVESAENVFEVLDGLSPTPLRETKAIDFKQNLPIFPDQTIIENARPIIEESLGIESVTVDEIVRNCQLSLPVVSIVLLEMELAGRLQRHPGNRVSIIPSI